MSRVIVIGGGTGGSSAAYHLLRMGHSVTLIAGERYIGYSKCGLPYLIGGYVEAPEELVEIPPDSLRAMGCDLIYPAWVSRIDVKERKVDVRGDDGSFSLDYECLVIATGAKPVVPEIPGVNLGGVHYLRAMEDALVIMERLKRSAKAVIIGANFTGIEMSEALLHLGLDVTLIDVMDRPLWRAFDADMSKMLLSRLGQEKKLRLYLGRDIERIVGDGEVQGVQVEGVGLIEADIVILGTGAVPNADLARASGLPVGLTGGVKVDEYLRVTDSIYAVGDCIETRNLVTGRPTLVQLSPAAQRQAWVAAMNVSGHKVKYRGDVPVAMTRFFDLFLGVAGYTEEQALKEGLKPCAKKFVGRLSSPFMDGQEKVHVKLVFDGSGRLLGGQVVGSDPQAVGQRTNLIAFMLQLGATAEDIALFRHGYAPPMSDVVDVFVKAGWWMVEGLWK